MRVLVACEFSNTMRDAFIRRGHDAYSCDLQCADYPNPNFRKHIRGDVRPLLREKWDLVIAHPPCTYLSIASTSTWVKGLPWHEQPRACEIIRGALFLLECLNANSSMVCVENPKHHNGAKDLIGITPTQEIEPYQFGHPYTKRTCLWLRGLPILRPTQLVKPTSQWMYTKNGGCKTTNERSRTFQGIANAMAEQWG